MKRVLLIILVIFSIAKLPLFSQNNLCQGAYWTELEAETRMIGFSEEWSDRSEWEARSAIIREGIIKGLGWDRIPEYSNHLNPMIHSQRMMDGYIVENIAIESFPGFYVTGNLYRPANGSGKFADILYPHDH